MAKDVASFDLAESWRRFERAVVPIRAGPEQRRQIRDAFYGGAGIAYYLAVAIGEPDVTEAEGLAALTRLRAEIDRYVSGRARDAERGAPNRRGNGDAS